MHVLRLKYESFSYKGKDDFARLELLSKIEYFEFGKKVQFVWDQIKPSLRISQEVWRAALSEVNLGCDEKEVSWQVGFSPVGRHQPRDQVVHISHVGCLPNIFSCCRRVSPGFTHQLLVVAPWLQLCPRFPRSPACVLLHRRQYPRKVGLVLTSCVSVIKWVGRHLADIFVRL